MGHHPHPHPVPHNDSAVFWLLFGTALFFIVILCLSSAGRSIAKVRERRIETDPATKTKKIIDIDRTVTYGASLADNISFDV